MSLAPNDLSLIAPQTKRYLSEERAMLIGGEFVTAHDGRTMPVEDPSSGEVIAEVGLGSEREIDDAISAAGRAFEAWRGLVPASREELIWRLSDLMASNAQELAELECLENGKPLEQAKELVHASVAFLRYMAGWATKLHGRTIDLSVPGKHFAYTLREPVGVVGAIIPWNVPLLMTVWKLGPALAAGCTVVLKPSPETPLSSLKVGQLAQEAGFPPGVINVVPGYGDGAGKALVRHKGVDKIAFTGSTEVGVEVGKSAMDAVKPVTLELGGKSPVIVLKDMDIAKAIEGAAYAIFANSGQICAAGSRLFVEREIHDAVVAGLVEASRHIAVGAGLDPKNQLGPLISARQCETVACYVDTARSEGATIASGGERIGDKGYFFKPTILTDVANDMRAVKEEIFGPVLAVMPFDDLDSAVHMANDTQYGLAAGVWTNDLTRLNNLVPKLKAGTVWVNCHHVYDAALPFGGYKESGIGREMGEEVFAHYTQTKSVAIAH